MIVRSCGRSTTTKIEIKFTVIGVTITFSHLILMVIGCFDITDHIVGHSQLWNYHKHDQLSKFFFFQVVAI